MKFICTPIIPQTAPVPSAAAVRAGDPKGQWSGLPTAPQYPSGMQYLQRGTAQDRQCSSYPSERLQMLGTGIQACPPSQTEASRKQTNTREQ